NECINCDLCRDACPFGAIRSADASVEKPLELERSENVRRLGMGVLLLVVLSLVGALAGWVAGPALSKLDSRVQQAEAIAWEVTNPSDGASATRAEWQRAKFVEAYRASGQKPEFFYAAAKKAVAQFQAGGAALGLWCGLVTAFCIMSVWFPRRRKEYEADPGACFACGRCWSACPVEIERRAKLKGLQSTDNSVEPRSSHVS
ncbi:TPA: hypothetical protein DDW35_11070, partial [Candidatus Sumerlaeota bacterium]|nr:hypothetical protein [Candidatus Sumerlaeota bacterium]